MPVKVASEWLNSCSGCEIAILNLGRRCSRSCPTWNLCISRCSWTTNILGRPGDGDIHHLDIPEAVVGLVSGGIRNQEHLEVAEAMRKSCQVIIALGTCATHGGIPSLINQFGNEELLDRYYHTETTDPGADAHTIRRCRRCWTAPTPWTKRSRWTSTCRAARRTRTRSPRPSRPAGGPRPRAPHQERLRHLPHHQGRQGQAHQDAALHRERPL